MTITTLQSHLDNLARELQRAELWDAQAPAAHQLMSVEPFCVDTLAFEQWLQWIFIPKMGDMLNSPSFNGLPNRSNIHAMADHVFKDYAQETDAICQIISEIDASLNQF